MKALVGAFNQEKVLVGAFSVIVQLVVEPMDSFTALICTLHLQGSTIVNDLYGSVNRTGLVIAGAALIGVSGEKTR